MLINQIKDKLKTQLIVIIINNFELHNIFKYILINTLF